MKTKLRITLLAASCLLTALRNGRSDHFEWTSAMPYMYEICGVEPGCNQSQSNLDRLKSNTKNICCKGCLCGDDCYENERVERTYAGLTKCLKTTEDAHIIVRYRFILDEPKDGCIISETSMTGIEPSCHPDVEAAPWGNFYPVYSFDKRANFKNEQCAACHGATDTVKWKVFLNFLGKRSERFGVLRKFYQVFKESDMKFSFYPQNHESQKYEHLCPTIKDKCINAKRDTFYIPTSVNLTRDQIVHACEDGIKSPYIYTKNDAFKNVFCAICIGRLSKVAICDEDMINIGDKMKGNGELFTSLIDHDFVESKMEENDSKGKIQLACLAYNTRNKSVEMPCREVLCPALQVRQQDGACRYPMKTIFVTKFIVRLNLTTPNIVEIRQIQNLSKTDLETLFKRTMPWPRKWELIEVFRRADNVYTKSTEFYVSVGYKNINFIDMHYLIRMVAAILSTNWTINFGKQYIFKQTFHKHGLFRQSSATGDNVELMKPRWALRPGINYILINLSSPTWEILLNNFPNFYSNPSGDIFEITNLYFCDQIEMYDYEFAGSSNDFPLMLKGSEKILYPWQFYMHKEENGTKTIIVCREDSDFELVHGHNDGSFPCMFLKNILFLVIAFLFNSHLYQFRLYQC